MPEELRPFRAAPQDTIGLFGLIALACTAQIATGQFSPTVESTIPHWMIYVSQSLLVLGAVITIVGSTWVGTNLTALQIEFVGRVTVAPPSLGYAGVIAWYVGLPGAITIAILTGLGVISILRARYIFLRVHETNRRLKFMFAGEEN